jgi:hypothetical protein
MSDSYESSKGSLVSKKHFMAEKTNFLISFFLRSFNFLSPINEVEVSGKKPTICLLAISIKTKEI